MQRAQRERERAARIEEARALVEQQLAARSAEARESGGIADGRTPSSSCVIC
jgi:hypothetical protein